MNPDEIAANKHLDMRVAQASQTVYRQKRRVSDARKRLEFAEADLAEAEAKLAAVDPVLRGITTVTKIHDALTELVPPDNLDLDLDADPRPAEDQAADFFNRPGDYHQVRIEVPEATNAECVIKFTPEQQPLIVETLRQLRGALFARITITKLEQPATDPPAAPALTTAAGTECNNGGRNLTADVATNFTVGEPETAIPEAQQHYRQRQAIADHYGIPIDDVLAAPSPTGDTAWTIKRPLAQTTGGRHAKPDDEPLTMTASTWIPGENHDPRLTDRAKLRELLNTDAIHDAAYEARDDD